MSGSKAGLPNNGVTDHFDITYDSTLPNGQALAAAFQASCEADYNQLRGWFGNIDLVFSSPIEINIVNAMGGASNSIPPEILSGVELVIMTINALLNDGTTSVAVIRYLLISELSELFMASQGDNWFTGRGTFSGGDEGSKGEGLSMFLATQFLISQGLATVPPLGFPAAASWLNSPRIDFITQAPDDHTTFTVKGCTTLFLYYLHDQRDFSIEQIIAAGSALLSGVYHNLTDQNDGWESFIGLINTHYPVNLPGIPTNFTYHPVGDTVFPVSTLVQLPSPNEITCGYGDTVIVAIDRPALAEVNILLASDNPALVQLPAVVTVPVGANTAAVPITTTAQAGPFDPIPVAIHASYAGVTLSAAVTVIAPRVLSLALAPDTVTCGDSSVATLTLDRASLLGDVVAQVLNPAPGFCSTPPTATIRQGDISTTFPITTPNIALPFKTAHSGLLVTYGPSSAGAQLTIKSRVVAGIMQSLKVMPMQLVAGGGATGLVTLVEAVPVETMVGLVATDPGGNPLTSRSAFVTLPASVAIGPGQISATFEIKAVSNITVGTRHDVRLTAIAVVSQTVNLVVES